MESAEVKIDFAVMEIALREVVVEKAKKANSTIVYMENGQLIEEDPNTSEKKILIKY